MLDCSRAASLGVGMPGEVHGVIRRPSTFSTDRIDHNYRDPHDSGARMFLHYGELTDGTGLRRILEKVHLDDVYNLGAQLHVKVSFDMPEYTPDVVGTGTLRLLDAVRDYIGISGKQVRFRQVGSSELRFAAPPL